jgi:hypothetical protein
MPGSKYCTLMEGEIEIENILGNCVGLGAKSYMTNDLLIYGENSCAFLHFLVSLS